MRENDRVNLTALLAEGWRIQYIKPNDEVCGMMYRDIALAFRGKELWLLYNGGTWYVAETQEYNMRRIAAAGAMDFDLIDRQHNIQRRIVGSDWTLLTDPQACWLRGEY